MLAQHLQLTAQWKTPAAALIFFSVAVGFVPTIAVAQAQERRSSPWRTFVVASPQELRVPPPPDEAATAAELKEVRDFTHRRDHTVTARINHWSTGGPAYRWNALAAKELILRGIPGTLAGRHMALVNVATYDAILTALDSQEAHGRARPSTRDPDLKPALPVPSRASYPSDHAAAAAAASEVLAYVFPDKAEAFRRMAQEAAKMQVHAGLAYPSDVEAGLVLGREIGLRVIARGKVDGSAAKWAGSVPAGPGMWTGTNPLSPLAGTWKTWVLTSGDALRPPPPPAPGSAQKTEELAEIKAVQRTPGMLSAAWFWEWGAGGFRGWFFWNEQASRKVLEYGLADKPREGARAFALESVAFHDAVVACWDAKYAYWAMRPFQVDPELKVLFPAPNHPSYPAAHACLSTAAASTLATLFPADGEELRDFAQQAAEARIWAGIHFRSDVVAGQKIGEAVAEQVTAFAAPTER